MSEEPTFDLDAAAVRAGGRELAVQLELLAHKLEGALPLETRVARRSRRLFSKAQVVAGIDVRLGDWSYALRAEDSVVTASRAQEVRGVVIRREGLELADWLEALRAGPACPRAQTSTQAREALERLTSR